MKVGFGALDDKDTLTVKELPLLDEDEWVRIRRRRDFTKDATAETKSLIWVSDEDAVKQAEEEDPEQTGEAPERVGGYRVDQGRLLVRQFEYMCDDWNVYDRVDGKRVQADFTAANREKFVRLHGAAVAAQLLIRGGGIAPDMSGKADPDTGKPLTFPQNPGVSPGEAVAPSGATPSL